MLQPPNNRPHTVSNISTERVASIMGKDSKAADPVATAVAVPAKAAPNPHHNKQHQPNKQQQHGKQHQHKQGAGRGGRGRGRGRGGRGGRGRGGGGRGVDHGGGVYSKGGRKGERGEDGVVQRKDEKKRMKFA